MSPEQAEGKPADARSDVFSFGAVLYEMLTGRRAFSGATKMSTLAAILTKEPAPPSHMIPGLSRDLEKLILRCLRKSPERRWQSMADLKVALEDLRDEFDRARTAEPPRRVTPPQRWKRVAIACRARDRRARRSAAWWLATPPRPETSPTTVPDAAHVGRRLDRLSSHLARWKDSRVRLRSQRREQPGHLGPADSRTDRRVRLTHHACRRSRALVLGRRKPDRLSVQPARRRHLCRPDARR